MTMYPYRYQYEVMFRNPFAMNARGSQYASSRKTVSEASATIMPKALSISTVIASSAKCSP